MCGYKNVHRTVITEGRMVTACMSTSWELEYGENPTPIRHDAEIFGTGGRDAGTWACMVHFVAPAEVNRQDSHSLTLCFTVSFHWGNWKSHQLFWRVHYIMVLYKFARNSCTLCYSTNLPLDSTGVLCVWFCFVSVNQAEDVTLIPVQFLSLDSLMPVCQNLFFLYLILSNSFEPYTVGGYGFCIFSLVWSQLEDDRAVGKRGCQCLCRVVKFPET